MKLDNLKEKNYSNVTSLISAIIFFIIGSIIFTNPNSTIKFISYVVGGCFAIIGLFKIWSYYHAKKKEEEAYLRDFSVGLIALIAGIVLIIFSNTVEALVRIIMGAWILFNGINLLINSIKGLKNKVKSSKLLIILSLIMIFFGIYMILKTNLIFQMIGLFIILYSATEIIGYIYYSQNN